MGEALYRVKPGDRGWIVHVSDEIPAEELMQMLNSLAARVIRNRSRFTAAGAEMHAGEDSGREAPKPKRRFGALKGKIELPEEFFDPLPGDELAAWET